MAEEKPTEKEGTESPKADYTILREQLTLLAKEYQSCDTVLNAISQIKDKYSFAKAYESTFSAVANKFDFEVEDDEVDDLKEEVEDLENQVSNLETELDELKENYSPIETLWDEYKAKHFRTYQNDYTEWELEELLKNGKKLLAQSNYKPLTLS
jgi:predicted  nucleic acid-binding Zn-ribbon protein